MCGIIKIFNYRATDEQITKCLQVRYLDNPVKTFTIGFESPEYDERKLAREVSRKFKTDHFEKAVVKDNFEDSLDKVLFHFDEPFGDSSALAVSNVARHASEHVKMVLTGDGGDALLSGYLAYQVKRL